MKPKIFWVWDSDGEPRHLAFSWRQASFCGRVGVKVTEWEFTDRAERTGDSVAAPAFQHCEECLRSPLNGEVELVSRHYRPVPK